MFFGKWNSSYVWRLAWKLISEYLSLMYIMCFLLKERSLKENTRSILSFWRTDFTGNGYSLIALYQQQQPLSRPLGLFSLLFKQFTPSGLVRFCLSGCCSVLNHSGLCWLHQSLSDESSSSVSRWINEMNDRRCETVTLINGLDRKVYLLWALLAHYCCV